jgi:hypothetical protein
MSATPGQDARRAAVSTGASPGIGEATARARPSADDRPMPEPAPVTTATRPGKYPTPASSSSPADRTETVPPSTPPPSGPPGQHPTPFTPAVRLTPARAAMPVGTSRCPDSKRLAGSVHGPLKAELVCQEVVARLRSEPAGVAVAASGAGRGGARGGSAQEVLSQSQGAHGRPVGSAKKCLVCWYAAASVPGRG